MTEFRYAPEPEPVSGPRYCVTRSVTDLSAQEKLDIRKRYEEKGESLKSLAESLGIHRTSLVRLKTRERWTVIPRVDTLTHLTPAGVARRAQADVIDLATRKVVEQAAANGVIAEAVDLITKALSEHAGMALEAHTLAKNMMEDFVAGKIEIPRGQSAVTIADAVMGLYVKAVELARRVAGIRDGQPSMFVREATDNEIVIEQRRLETVTVEVNGRGRMIHPEDPDGEQLAS